MALQVKGMMELQVLVAVMEEEEVEQELQEAVRVVEMDCSPILRAV